MPQSIAIIFTAKTVHFLFPCIKFVNVKADLLFKVTEINYGRKNSNLKTPILWDVKMGSLLQNKQDLVEICCLHLQGRMSTIKMEPGGCSEA
jgi:hypothetical protein